LVESLAKVIRSLFRDIEDFDLIEKGKLGILKKEIAEIERMLKKLIKSLENKPLLQRNEDPVIGEPWTSGILEPSSPTKFEKNLIFKPDKLVIDL